MPRLAQQKPCKLHTLPRPPPSLTPLLIGRAASAVDTLVRKYDGPPHPRKNADVTIRGSSLFLPPSDLGLATSRARAVELEQRLVELGAAHGEGVRYVLLGSNVLGGKGPVLVLTRGRGERREKCPRESPRTFTIGLRCPSARHLSLASDHWRKATFEPSSSRTSVWPVPFITSADLWCQFPVRPSLP